MYQDRRTTIGLTAAGVLPFAGLAAAAWLGVEVERAREAFGFYGAIIAAFMAGTIWTQAQFLPADSRRFLIISNVAALAAFGALLLPGSGAAALVIQMLVCALLLWCDHALHRRGQQPAWYFAMRRAVTIAVLVIYGVMLAA